MPDKTSIGDRMKEYEKPTNHQLTRRIPVTIRVDGKAFSKWTKGLIKPADNQMENCMLYAAFQLCKNIEGVRFAYTQSDEITLLMVDYQYRKSQAWFDYRLQKVCSVSAAISTGAFNHAARVLLSDHYKRKGYACFDSRVYSIPAHEVVNNFIWRQQDATRNSIQSNGRVFLSHKEAKNMNGSQIQELLFQKFKFNWNDLPAFRKRGTAIFKLETQRNGATRKRWVMDTDMPIITQNKSYVEKWVKPEPKYPKRNKRSYVDLDDYFKNLWM